MVRSCSSSFVRTDEPSLVPLLFVALTNQRCFLGQGTTVEDRTLPLFQHLRGPAGHGGPGTAIEYRKKNRLWAARRPEVSSRARCAAVGPHGRGPPATVHPSRRSAKSVHDPPDRLTGHLLLLLTNAKLMKKRCNDTFKTFFVTLSWRQVESVCSVSCRALCLFVLVLVVSL